MSGNKPVKDTFQILPLHLLKFLFNCFHCLSTHAPAGTELLRCNGTFHYLWFIGVHGETVASCHLCPHLPRSAQFTSIRPQDLSRQSSSVLQRHRRQRNRDWGRDRGEINRERESVIYLQPLGCWTGCCCCNILNLTGKDWCWSDSSCWCTVVRSDRTHTHAHTHNHHHHHHSCLVAVVPPNPKDLIQDLGMLY